VRARPVYRVAAIVDEPRLSGVSRILKGPNRVTLLKYVDIARMKLDDIDMICTQSFQAAVDAVDHRQVGPRLAVVAVYSVACFRGEEELLPSA